MRQVLKFSTYPPPETRDGIGFLQGSKGGKRAELISRNEILTVRDRESIKIEGAVGFFSLKNCDAILGRTLGVAQRRQDPGSAIFPLFLAPIPSPSPYFPRPFLLLSSSLHAPVPRLTSAFAFSSRELCRRKCLPCLRLDVRLAVGIRNLSASRLSLPPVSLAPVKKPEIEREEAPSAPVI